jgi:hypothetical protein
MKTRKHQRIVMMLATLLVVTSGCIRDEDERLARMAQETSQRQAEQNREMAQLNREVAESHKRLVEADAEARQEVIQLQRDVVQRDAKGREELNQMHQNVQIAAREERASLDRAQQQLETERRQLAQQRNRETVLGAVITNATVLLACFLPLIVAVYVLRAIHRQDPTEAELAELLTHELLAERPFLVPSRTAEHRLPTDASPAVPQLPDETAQAGSPST